MSKPVMPFLTKVAKANTSESLRTTIPKELVQDYGLNAHDVLIWSVDKKGKITVEKWSGRSK